ncbi:MAG: T9SS type A sorting domain-containing protein [Candidatus Neomarinimicrobiota bacterium]
MKNNSLSCYLLSLFVSMGLGGVLTSAHAQPDQISASIRTATGETLIAKGDTVTFLVYVNPAGERLTGYDIFLTVDPSIFKPLFTTDTLGDTVYYRPFRETNQLIWDNSPQVNDTHGDIWGKSDMLNGIPGFQMDFIHQTAPGAPRRTFRKAGTAAFFDMVVMDFPADTSNLAYIRFDIDYVVPGGGSRETKYHPEFGDAKYFPRGNLHDLAILIAGLAIYPPIPDTVLAPGLPLIIPLEDHFKSSLYSPADAIWNVTASTPLPPGTSFNMIGDSLIITTNPTAHGIIDLTIDLDVPDGLYSDSQALRVYVDYPPVVGPLSIPIQFDEDDSLTVPKADLFTDPDDSGSGINLWIQPESPIYIRWDPIAEEAVFTADPHWFGSSDIRLFIQDTLGPGFDTLLTAVVNSVNDAPVVDFSVLGDTVVIHRSFPDTLDLRPFVSDVDNLQLTWSVSNPDPTNLSTTLLPPDNDRLELLAADYSPFKDINLVLTATDSLGAQGSDTLVVSIRSWPPEIGPLPDIKILASVPDTLSLNELVSDNDTPDSLMTWSFEVVDFISGVPDPQVSITYDQLSQRAIFNTPTGYDAADLLILTVEDDDNNTDTDTTRLKVFSSFSPFIFPLDTVVVYRDTITEVLDLDDYVLDPIYDPENITWSYSGGDSLEAVQIGADHVLTLVTDPFFFGYDSITFIATNPDAYSDTSVLVVRVIPRVDGPPLWQPLPASVEIVYPDTIDLLTLTEVCKDDFTPRDQLIFSGFVNPDPGTPLNLAIDSVSHLARISVPALDVYDTWLFFSAEDNQGQVSYSDTVQVLVKDSYSPVWAPIPTISMYVNQTFSDLFLQDYLSDRDTPLSSLTITYFNPNPRITVIYDPATTQLTIQASGYATESWITFYATDPSGNTAMVRLRVIVSAIIDVTPPEGGLTYFFNPAADKWIHFVLVGDSTTARIKTKCIYNAREVPLAFTQQDSLPGTLTWIAPYRFQYPGVYQLKAELIDDYNNALNLSLPLSVAFSKAMGDIFASPDSRVTVSYPQASIVNGRLLILTEESALESISGQMAELAGGKGDTEDSPQAPPKVYSLDTNLPEPLLVTLTYDQPQDTDPYYSFYQVAGDKLLKIDTYTSGPGQFEAAVLLGQDVILAHSDTPAHEAPLPGAELFCYPNPFNATLQVRFMLRQEDQGRIVVYNLLGREVFASPRQPLGPGVHVFHWQGIDNRGRLVPSGAYIIRLETVRGTAMTRKVTLLK